GNRIITMKDTENPSKRYYITHKNYKQLKENIHIGNSVPEIQKYFKIIFKKHKIKKFFRKNKEKVRLSAITYYDLQDAEITREGILMIKRGEVVKKANHHEIFELFDYIGRGNK
ncbi:hypothetical protein KAU11_12360, partial [Candidatus Babeliales bacterium]|nr:hypothetical protein [Candidatus Babeliales bacterium]